MKSVLLTAAFALGAAAQQLTINTPVPGAAQCQPFLIQWSGGTPPYFVTVQTNPPGTTPFVDFGQQSGTQLTWKVNGTLGESLIFQIKDNTGQPASSAPFTVTAGSGDSCIGAGGGSTGGGSSAPGDSSAPGGAGPTSASGGAGGSTPGGSTPGGASTNKPTSSTSGSGSTPSQPGAAQALKVPAFAAVLGAGLIAALA